MFSPSLTSTHAHPSVFVVSNCLPWICLTRCVSFIIFLYLLMIKQWRIEKSVPVSCNLSALLNNETLPDNKTSQSNIRFVAILKVPIVVGWPQATGHVHPRNLDPERKALLIMPH